MLFYLNVFVLTTFFLCFLLSLSYLSAASVPGWLFLMTVFCTFHLILSFGVFSINYLKVSVQIDSSSRSQMFSASSSKGYSNDNNSESSYIPNIDTSLAENHSHTGEDFSLVPPEDDIEKSVHLNQDGSMTVEMRVRFNIKEEETIKWTTTVSRAGTSAVVAEDESCGKNAENFNRAEDDVSLQPINTEVISQDISCGTKASNYDIWQNSSVNVDMSQAKNDKIKPFYRPPTPGPRRVKQKKSLVESVTVVSDTAVQKKMVGQYSYSEEMDNGDTKSEYCLVTHSSSKTSSVTTPKLSEICSNHTLNQSQDDQTEEETSNKVTIKKSNALPCEDGLLQNVLEKSVAEEGLDNNLTSGYDSSISHAQSSVKKSHATGLPLLNQSDQTGREVGSFNSHPELSQSRSEEVICNQCKGLPSSQTSIHDSPPGSSETVCKCTQISPPITESSSITVKNSATHLSDGSQAASSSSKKKSKKKKKKKRKSSSDIVEQGTAFPQNLHDISAEATPENDVKTCEMHITRESAPHSSPQITVHKRVLALPVANLEGSNKGLGLKEDLYSQVSKKSQKNELESNLKQNLNRQLPKLKAKSDKKPHLKVEEVLMAKDHPKNEIEQIKEGTCDTANVTEQTPGCIVSWKPLTDTGSGPKAEKEKRVTSAKSHKSSLKHKKVKKNKKPESALGSKVPVLDETRTLDSLRNAALTNEIAELSLESYVQNWLQNIFPNAAMPEKHLPPMNSNNRTMHQLSVKSFSDKESQLVGKNACLSGNKNISESKLSNGTLNHLSELGTVEESVKKLYEGHIGCLTDAEASLIEEAKYLLQSDIQSNNKLSMCNIIHENDKKKVLLETSDQRYISEIAAQVNANGTSNILGPDMQKDCVSGLLLHQLKSTVLSAEKNHVGCITDISSSSLLGSSSNLLLAWLLLLNLKETLSNINKDDMVQTTCSCSEVFTLLQYLKQVAIKEEAEDLKTAVSNLQDCTANHLIFSGMQIEKQEPTYHKEIFSQAEIKHIPVFEEEGKVNKNLTFKNRLSSEEVIDAEVLAGELERSSGEEGEENCSTPVENSDLNDLDVHDEMQNLNCINADLNSCGLASNEDLPTENEQSSFEHSSFQGTQEKTTDTSFNNEESEISQEPKSSTHSMTSNDKDHMFDLETSELDDKEVKGTEDLNWTNSVLLKKNSSECLTSIADNTTNGDIVENSVREDMEEDGTCEETSERLSTPSPLSFCYESKQIPGEEEQVSRVKLIVKELEGGSYSNSSLEFKKCLKSPATSDLSDYRPETDESDYNVRHSSDLTNESVDEAIYEKEYNKGYVKRTIERLYGKAEASFKSPSKLDPPYLTQTLQGNAVEEPCHDVMEGAPLLRQKNHTWLDEFASPKIPEDLNANNDMWEKENATLPAPQFSLNGEEAYYNDDCSVEYTNQHCQAGGHIAEDEGVLIDKGKWLLKENHLIRRSPPENSGMYGNAETTSADTAFDNHSDEIPYSHFGNLNLRPPLKEISSSELEDMAKPYDNGCNYFNMPHNSDSDPFSDTLSIQSRNNQCSSSLLFEAACNSSTQFYTEVKSNSPALTSVEFRLPDNKVHPAEQSSNDEPIQTQPISNTHSSRNSREDQDSLDKLHAICGQHCPILTAIIKPTNEEIRGCAYQKASDVENQVGSHLLTNTPYFVWQGKNITGLYKYHTDLKNSSINNIANNIFNRLYADNTLDFMNGSTFSLLVSAALKENQGLKKLYVTENIDVGTQEINSHENNASSDAFSEITVEQNNNLSVLQNSKDKGNKMVAEKPTSSLADVTEGCKHEKFHHHEALLNSTGLKVTVNLEGENTLSIKEETSPYVKEDESDNEYSDSEKSY
ncbi:oxygen-regulated protein 1-like [Podarcis raffonei]|uniref:oxygen-regulated protein 1-like n=1 Tax=Podarcis raffonei TaxID=65483 RepID=UPI0023296679|nr:oxygen-regulated protein 1-like [Podarcis raffonei]